MLDEMNIEILDYKQILKLKSLIEYLNGLQEIKTEVISFQGLSIKIQEVLDTQLGFV